MVNEILRAINRLCTFLRFDQVGKWKLAENARNTKKYLKYPRYSVFYNVRQAKRFSSETSDTFDYVPGNVYNNLYKNLQPSRKLLGELIFCVRIDIFMNALEGMELLTLYFEYFVE